MSSIGDLNVRLGVVTKDFDKALKNAQRSLRRTALDMEDAGRAISQTISAPIIGAGVAALKSAADFERYEKALIAVSGSASEAEAQLDRLQKIAEAPGIGFDQAVAASLQFQGLGLEAAQAEEAIKQVANIVAASGGGSQAFAGAIRQLNQIQAKNRVLQEDINILLENAPVLGNVFQQEFGAKTADAIRDAGISGEEFFQRLIKNLSTVERVQGGLFNTFENFTIAVRKALADLGQDIDEAVGIQGIVDNITKAIQRVVQVFSDLDTETKKSVIRFAALAAAAGPVVFVGAKALTIFRGFFNVVSAGLVPLLKLIAYLEVQAATAIYGAAATGTDTAAKGAQIGVIRKLINAFKALSAAQKLTVIGLAAATVGFLVNKFLEYRDAIKQVTDAKNAIDFVERKAIRSAEREIDKVDQVIKKIREDKLSRAERTKAIAGLIKQYPKFFENLDAEKASLEDLIKARTKLRSAIIATARARAAEAKLQEIESKILDKKEDQYQRIQKLKGTDQLITSEDGLLTVESSAFERQAEAIRKNGEELQELYKIRDRFTSIIKEARPSIPEENPEPLVPTSDDKPGAGLSANFRPGFSLVTQLAIEGTKRFDDFSESIGLTFEKANLLDTVEFQSFTPKRFTDFAQASEIAEGRANLLREELAKVDFVAQALGQNVTMDGKLDVLNEKLATAKTFLKTTAEEFEGNEVVIGAVQDVLAELNAEYNRLAPSGKAAELVNELKDIDAAARSLGRSLSVQEKVEVFESKISAAKSALEAAAVKFEDNNEVLEQLRAILEQINEQYEEFKKNNGTITDQLGVVGEMVVQLADGIQNSLKTAFTDFFTTIAEGGADAWDNLRDSFRKAIRDMITQLLAAIAAAAILAALVSIIFPQAAVGGSKGFGALFKNFFSGGGLKDLALGRIFDFSPRNYKGGIVPPGYPNDTYLTRLSSGEAIIPLHRLGAIIQRNSGGGGNLTSTIRGEDIVLSYERAKRKKGR